MTPACFALLLALGALSPGPAWGESFSAWASTKVGVKAEDLVVFFSDYLTTPSDFPESIKKKSLLRSRC